MSFLKAFASVQKTVNNVFGTDFILTHVATSNTSEAKGVFDNSFIDINGVDTKQPNLKIRLADLLAEPIENDTVQIGSINYRVLSSHSDSYGSSIILLQKI